MTRWLNPIVFLGGGLYVWHHNAKGADTLVVPGSNFFVGDDIIRRGEVSWQFLVGVGVLFTLWELARLLRKRGDS